MDWPKAKTLLIICFLLLNMFMSYELYIQPALLGTSDNISPGRFDSILNVLGENGFDIQVPIPRSTPQKSSIRVAARPLSQEEILGLRDRLLGSEAVLILESKMQSGHSSVTYMLGAQELIVTSLGYVSYYNRSIFTDSGPMSQEDAQRAADYFVSNRLDGSNAFAYDSIEHIEPMGYRVQYAQIYQDTNIYPAHLMVLVNPSGVAAAWMSRLQIRATEGDLKAIRSAAEALLSLLSYRLTFGETAQLTILEMELGYYSKLHYTLDPWSAAPVWRIRTDKGDFYLNAHSGVVED